MQFQIGQEMFGRNFLKKNEGILMCRKFSATPVLNRNHRVVVVGAAGGIGQSLSLLLKMCPLVTELHLYDLKHSPGISVDLSYIETPTKVKGYVGVGQVKDALRGADILIITAGTPRKVGMSHEDLFISNARVMKEIASVSVEVCPTALVAIVTNPINIVVPIFCKVLEKYGRLDRRKIFGVCTIDATRANTIMADFKGLNPMYIKVPVVGGHAGYTIVPLFSKTTPRMHLPHEMIVKLTKKVQTAGNEVVKAKAGRGGSQLSVAYAAARFVISLLRALDGEPAIVESAYVISDVTDCSYFSTPLLLGNHGIKENLGIPAHITPYEVQLIDRAVKQIQKNIALGEKYAVEEELD